MTEVLRERPTRPYCNCLAQERGLDPAGYAADADTIVLLETPLPWRDDIYDKPGALPENCSGSTTSGPSAIRRDSPTVSTRS